jgi:hypothetical protein
MYTINMKKIGKTSMLILTMMLAAQMLTVPYAAATNGYIWDSWVYIVGTPVTTPFPLVAGRLYRIVTSPDYPNIPWLDYGGDPPVAADAQYYSIDPSDDWNWDTWNPAPGGHSFLQINGDDMEWGDYDPDHEYSIFYEGEGAAITFHIEDWYDEDPSNNYCHLHVYIYDMGVYTIGYWKNHPEAWPVDEIEIGGVTYSKSDAIAILKRANSKCATLMLAAQLIAAKLNVANGASPPGDTIDEADEFLVDHPICTPLSKALRQIALSLKDTLDSYNNGY